MGSISRGRLFDNGSFSQLGTPLTSDGVYVNLPGTSYSDSFNNNRLCFIAYGATENVFFDHENFEYYFVGKIYYRGPYPDYVTTYIRDFRIKVDSVIIPAYNIVIASEAEKIVLPPEYMYVGVNVTGIEAVSKIVPDPYPEISDKITRICELLQGKEIMISEKFDLLIDALKCGEQSIACILKTGLTAGVGSEEKSLAQAVEDIEPVWIENELRVDSRRVRPDGSEF